MPIRRAAATPTPEKVPSAAAEKELEASEESPSADEEPAASSAAPAEEEAGKTEPTENGENAEGAAEEKGDEGMEGKKDDKCKDCAAGQCATHCYVLLLRLKDGYKYKGKGKKVKRTIPAWASINASKKLPVTNFAGNQKKVDNILMESITSCNKSGVSWKYIMNFTVKKYPDMDRKKFLIKKALKKHLEKGTIKQLKGKGLSGTFTIGKQSASAKKKTPQKTEALGDALPLIITRICEPKEASYYLIKKYLEQHFPSLNIQNRPEVLKAAMVEAVEKRQLDQITGKGATGTFQLKRTGGQVLLKGGPVEDAITAAITAMNEPKTCSFTTLRKYLVSLDANKDTKETRLVASLRRTLTKCKVLGWMEQITGHGFSGTYRLSFPFYPSPTILDPEKFKEPPKTNKPTPQKGRKRMAESSDEEEESEESEDEAPPTKRKSQKRPPPKNRGPPPTKKSPSALQSKSKGRGRPSGKKTPVKKAASPTKKLGKKLGKKPLASKKPSTPTPKATPVKKGAPAKKTKAPAVKQMTKRGSSRPVYRESSGEEEEEEEAEEKNTKSASKRSKPAESSPKKPAVKKPAAKSGARRSKAKESSPKEPVVKSGAKNDKKSTRKSSRGK